MLWLIGICNGGGLFNSGAVAGGGARVVADAERLLHKKGVANVTYETHTLLLP